MPPCDADLSFGPHEDIQGNRNRGSEGKQVGGCTKGGWLGRLVYYEEEVCVALWGVLVSCQ